MCLVRVEFDGIEPAPNPIDEVVDIATKATAIEVMTLFGERVVIANARILRVDLTNNVVRLSRSVGS